jgi:broad specificity phosphatase PhoE
MTNPDSLTRVILIRHGTTDWIEQGILHGISDRPLSPFGLEEARLTGLAMKGTTAAGLYTSPLLRTMQTAQAVAGQTGLVPQPLEGLQEMDFGWLEGKVDLWPKLKAHKMAVNLYYVCRAITGLMSGETLPHFQNRVLDTWSFIRSQADGRLLIIVAHAGVLRTILLHEFGGKFNDATRFTLRTCSISEIEITPNTPSRLIRLNDTNHLNHKEQP